VADDDAIERIARPVELARGVDDRAEVQAADLDSDPSLQLLDDRPCVDTTAPDLAQELELQQDRRRYEEGFALDRVSRPGAARDARAWCAAARRRGRS